MTRRRDRHNPFLDPIEEQKKLDAERVKKRERYQKSSRQTARRIRIFTKNSDDMDKELDSLAGWNSVSDTSPAYGLKVLVYDKVFGCTIAYLKPNRDGTTSWMSDTIITSVSHWQPLPGIPPSQIKRKQ